MTTSYLSGAAASQTIAAARTPRPSVQRPVPGIFRTIAKWLDRQRQRRHLAELNDRLLEDIGVTRAEAAGEIAKPFWR